VGGEDSATVRQVDRALVISVLQAAEDHLAIGARQIAKQRQLVSRLERDGVDTTDAIALLREMERTQELHAGDRDRLRAELAVLNAVETAKAGDHGSK
jgi:hypothetical protein